MKSLLSGSIFKQKIKIIFLLSFLTIKGMDSPPKVTGSPVLRRLQGTFAQETSPNKPIFLKSVDAWDNEKLINSGKESTRHISQSMIIIPSGKGALYTAPGETRFVCTETIVPSEPHLMYRHSNDVYHPLIAAAMKTGNELILASVLNRIGQQPEYILSKHKIRKSNNTSHDIFLSAQFKFLSIHSNVKTIGAASNWDDSNVQAVALSANGEYLAIGFPNFVQLADLVTETSYRSIFPKTLSPQAFVVDVSTPTNNFLDQKESHVASVNNKGHIDCKRFTSDEVFMNVKNISTGDRIENVHLIPDAKELWYVTESGQVNTIDFRTFLEHCDDEIKKRMVSYHEGSKASVDQGSQQTSIHWCNNPQAEDALRLRINVYRESHTGMQPFVLELPSSFPKIYNCIGAQGQKTSAPVCIKSAVVRGSIVACFLNNGKIAFWRLPDKNEAPEESKVTGVKATEVPKRNRSLSSPEDDTLIRKYAQTSPATIDEKRRSGKKSSHQVPKMTIFKSRESLKEKQEKADAKGGNISPTESPRKLSKPETPRKTKSIPASSNNESKFEHARKADIYNDFNRKEQND